MQLITSRGIHPWAALKSQLMRKFSVITFMCIIFAFDPLTHAIELHNSFSIGQKCKWISHFPVSCAFISKRVLVQNHSYENVFDLHENETACRTHFHVKGFALRLVLKRRPKRPRKWSVHVNFILQTQHTLYTYFPSDKRLKAIAVPMTSCNKKLIMLLN